MSPQQQQHRVRLTPTLPPEAWHPHPVVRAARKRATYHGTMQSFWISNGIAFIFIAIIFGIH